MKELNTTNFANIAAMKQLQRIHSQFIRRQYMKELNTLANIEIKK